MAEADLGSSLELQRLPPLPVLEFQSTRHGVTTAQVYLLSKPEKTDRDHTPVFVSAAIAALSPKLPAGAYTQIIVKVAAHPPWA